MLPYLEIIVKRRFLWFTYWKLIHRAPSRDNDQELIDAYTRKHVDKHKRELHWTVGTTARILDGGIITPAKR